MKHIFVNLKRFDVPRSAGGVCPSDTPGPWIADVMAACTAKDLGQSGDPTVTFMVPEALILPAIAALPQGSAIQIGSQGVFRENITKGANFGAFTTNLPAKAAVNLGCTWSIIGHSEERKDKLGVIATYDPDVETDSAAEQKAHAAVNQMINQEVLCALDDGLDALICIGETAAQRGTGSADEQNARVKAVLEDQLTALLAGTKDYLANRKLVIGYEPIWAIGPGKTPPDSDTIAFVAAFVKEVTGRIVGTALPVVYGGGLKEDNAAMLGGLSDIDGGLVALTRFSGEIGFYAEDFAIIIERYMEGVGA